jgi:hypothetical protein
MRIQADGALEGILGGYQEFYALYRAAHDALESDRVYSPMSCADFRRAAKTLQDGYPAADRAASCSWISVAYEVRALPAIVVEPRT